MGMNDVGFSIRMALSNSLFVCATPIILLNPAKICSQPPPTSFCVTGTLLIPHLAGIASMHRYMCNMHRYM